ncbi:crossover junction endodeoxyribonuclease RuvA [Campylobacter ornithocola]|uniref:Crossover junction endodeoxyribonuclease RuvA n=1 Tax=Campylobacter ornithocola TaxID=1848766 RepID=A0A6M8MWQ3_9BACT|nr:hypothetical protein [Campylobacter ornithocola]OCX42296.1 crossover junction endodeoxyribonuclease RuvA [Campylobacter ornithocola]QKF57178.1 endodeoxyribonuclease, RusA family [Campylobacter ornithocola]
MSYSLKLELKNNPVPYKRTTQRAKYTSKDYKKYQDFKDLLRVEFLKQNKLAYFKAFDIKKTYEINLKIGFKNKRHGDGDNILKGVLDALFVDDKNVLRANYEIVSFKKAFLEINIKEYDFLERTAS